MGLKEAKKFIEMLPTEAQLEFESRWANGGKGVWDDQETRDAVESLVRYFFYMGYTTCWNSTHTDSALSS